MPARIIYDYMHVMNLTSFKIEQHQGTREKSEFIRQMQHRPLTTEEIKVHWAHDLVSGFRNWSSRISWHYHLRVKYVHLSVIKNKQAKNNPGVPDRDLVKTGW